MLIKKTQNITLTSGNNVQAKLMVDVTVSAQLTGKAIEGSPLAPEK